LKRLNHLFPHHFIMKNSRILLVLLALFGLSALTINAAQLATAKVLSVTGTVNTYNADGTESPLAVGAILAQGDSVVTTALSETPASHWPNSHKKPLAATRATSNYKPTRASHRRCSN
jgi:chitinase